MSDETAQQIIGEFLMDLGEVPWKAENLLERLKQAGFVVVRPRRLKMSEKEMQDELETTIVDWEAAMRMQHEAGQDLIRLEALLSRVLIAIDCCIIYECDDLLKEIRDAVGHDEEIPA